MSEMSATPSPAHPPTPPCELQLVCTDQIMTGAVVYRPCALLHTGKSCCPLRHSPLPRLLQAWPLYWPPRFQSAIEFITLGGVM